MGRRVRCGSSKRLRAVGLAGLALLCVPVGPGASSPARAQTAMDESVQRRPRPDYDPEGLYFNDIVDGLGRAIGVVPTTQPRSDSTSTVVVHPTVEFGTYYDDNVRRSPSNPQGDFAHTARAALDIDTPRDTNGFELGGYGEVGYFDRLVSENYHQFGGHVGGWLVPTDETRFGFNVTEDRLREPREDTAGAVGQTRPTVYHLLTSTVSGEYRDDDWLLVSTGMLKRYTYQPNAPVVIGSEYDRNEWTGSFRIGHTVSEGSAVFIEPQVDTRRYDETVSPVDGFRHDSSGYQVVGGAHFDFSSVTYAEIGAGWMVRHYVDPAFPTLSGPTMLATATWNPRDWITVTLNGGRQVNEAVIPNVSGVETTYAQTAVDYEIDYNWLASVNLGYTTADYRGSSASTGPQRSDTILNYGLGTRYLVARGASVGIAWTAYDRTSNTAGVGLRFNQYLATVQLQW